MVPDAKWLVDPGNCPLPLAATYTCSGLTTYSAVRKCMLSMQGKLPEGGSRFWDY